MSATKSQMRDSWLVQRLRRPIGSQSILGQDNPFAFGGGLRNGGLSADAMNLLRPIFSFDYMGAAEFEFGAVPKALRRIAEAADKSELAANRVMIPLADVQPHWRFRNSPAPEGDAVVYTLSRQADADEVEARIRQWASGNERLKEMTRLASSLRPHDDWDSDTAGWIELDNGFMFFIDRGMWQSTCAIFGVEVTR